jgi:trans-2,3-dihydro-3-hydroxyanthranilate isomerase
MQLENPLADPSTAPRTRVRYVVCDVFTDRPLAGNQLGVFPDAAGLSTESMQALTRELNYSESTFVLPPEQGGDARVRIFTPGRELPFAGHPTLGTASVITGERGLDGVRLETGRGIVPVRFELRAGLPFGWMEQPLPTIAPWERADELVRILGLERSALPVEVYDNGVRHVFVALDSEATVARLRPDMARLEELVGDTGVNCFAPAGARWKTRMFGPGVGVPEDPATGSAAGPLALHLARHRWIAWGEEIEIRQGAEIGRPSILFARVDGKPDGIRGVRVGGSAIVVARGEFAF